MNEEQKQLIIGELQAAVEQIKFQEHQCNGEKRRLAHNTIIPYYEGYKQAVYNIINIMGYNYENGDIIATDNHPFRALLGRVYNNEE